MNNAYAELLRELAATRPVEFSLFPTADEYDANREHLARLVSAVDDYISAFGREAADNAGRCGKFSRLEWKSVLSDAAHDRGLFAEMEAVVEQLTEEESDDIPSDRDEHGTLNRAHQFGGRY